MKKNENKDLKLNIVVGMLNQFLVIVLNLISKNAIQTSLGIEYMGMQTVFSNICDLLTFAFNGIGVGVLYSFYRPIEENDQSKIQRLYKYYNKLYRNMTFFSLIFGCGAILLIPIVINIDISVGKCIISYLLFMLSVVFYNRFLLNHYVLISYQKRYIVCLLSGIIESVILIVEIWVLKQTSSYELFLLCILVKNVLVHIGVFVYLKKMNPVLFHNAEKNELFIDEKKEINKNIKDLIVCRVGSVLIHSTDSILISGLISTKISGCYSNYYFVFSGVTSICNSFFESILAKIGSISVRVTKNDFFLNFWKVSMISLWLNGFCVTCYYLLVKDFIVLWIGTESILSHEFLIIMTCNLYLEGMKLVGGTYRKTVGLFDKFDKIITLRGVMNIVLSVTLGIRYGLIGILVATIITNLVTIYWYVPYRLYKYFEKSLKYEVLYQILGLISVLICIFVTGICSSFVDGTTWLGFFGKTFVCVLVSNVCYLMFAFIYRATEKRIKWNMQ